MRFICDFHIHSRYSRATSKNIDLENLAKWANIKGISVLGTGDFTHPEWIRELKEKLEPSTKGLFRLKKSQEGQKKEIQFILTSEISCIYTKGGKVRKIHIVIFAPSFNVVERINTKLAKTANLKSDGRPIIGMDAKELMKIALDASPECFIVPAHIWTPWFSIFGSKSGFDSIEECFEELSPYVFALETGLSSDPEMNWRLSTLDKYTLISNSDAHSAQKIGREANIFEGKKENLNYDSIIDAIKRGGGDKGKLNLIYTTEFFPEEGKYHFDGHRNCKICLSPEERKKYGGICPNCGKKLTVGVLSRVDELSDRKFKKIDTISLREKKNLAHKKAIPFIKMVPLCEIISEAVAVGPTSKRVQGEYNRMINIFGSEFDILLNIPICDISKKFSKTADGIKKVREGNLRISPGYDGEYGKVKIFEQERKIKKSDQKTLF